MAPISITRSNASSLVPCEILHEKGSPQKVVRDGVLLFTAESSLKKAATRAVITVAKGTGKVRPFTLASPLVNTISDHCRSEAEGLG